MRPNCASPQRRQVLVLLIAMVGLSVLARPAWSHARMVRSNPADKSQLESSPKVVEIWFNELLDENFNQVSIFPAKEVTQKQRSNLAKGKPQVDAKDRTRLFVEVEALPPGDYVVEWRVLSRDGHSAPGRFSFRVLEPKK